MRFNSAMLQIRTWLGLLLIGVVFGAITFFARQHAAILESFVESQPVLGIFVFLCFGLLDSTIAPGSMFVLIPVAGKVWGPWWASFLTVVGWDWGAFAAFYIANRYGYPLVKRFVSKNQMDFVRHYIPKNLFSGVIFLRLVFPLDIVSYVMGLFTNMSTRDYLIATTIGVAPSAIFLSYLGSLPPIYEYITYASGAIVFIWFIRATGKTLAK